jgi:hypothetical protein
VAIGDCAFGYGATRERYDQAGRELAARLPKRPNSGLFAKEDFQIDLHAMTRSCPAGQTTHRLVSVGRTVIRSGEYTQGQAFQFEGTRWDACQLWAHGASAKPAKGRTVRLYAQERLL